MQIAMITVPALRSNLAGALDYQERTVKLASAYLWLSRRFPETFDDVRAVIEADLGRPISAVFAEFSETPLAAASIAQVHLARLHTGEEVVVKVQRPRVATLVREDIATLSWLAPFFVGRIPVAALGGVSIVIFSLIAIAGAHLGRQQGRFHRQPQHDGGRGHAGAGHR